MGLDMYLYKDYYIGGEYDDDPERTVEFETNQFGRHKEYSFKIGEISTVRCLVAQWRKAYAIDDWFMDKYSEGRYSFYVPQEAIPELYDIVCEVLADHSKAQKLLPFDTNFEDWYWDDLKETKEWLAGIAQEIREGADYYLYYEHSA